MLGHRIFREEEAVGLYSADGGVSRGKRTWFTIDEMMLQDRGE